MHRLPVLCFIIFAACSQQKQPGRQPVNTTAIQQQLNGLRQTIAQTTQTGSLLALYRQQISLARQINNWHTLCGSHQAIYDLLSDSLPAAATPHLDSIVQLEDTLRNSNEGRAILAIAYGNRYYWYDQQELNHKVVADCEKYLQYSNPSIDSGYLSLVLKAAGIATSQIGDQRQSVIYLEKLLKWEQQLGDAEAIASAAINLANSYNNNGRYNAALKTAEEALRLNGVSAERRSYLHAIQAQVQLQQHQYPLAWQASQKAITLLQPLTGAGGYNERMSVLLKVNADVLAALRQERAALQACYNSLDYLRLARPTLTGRDAGKTCIALARLYRTASRTDSALRYCNMAISSVCDSVTGSGITLLPDPAGLHPENTIMEALDEKALLLEHMYTATPDTVLLATALQCYDRAFEVEQQLRRFFIYDNSKYMLGAESKARSEAAIRICLALERQTKRPFWAEQAFTFSEKSRAGALLDKVRENLLASAAKDTAFAKAGQMQLRAARLEEQLAGIPVDSSTAARRAELEAERDKYLQLLAQYKTDINIRLDRLYDDFAGRSYTAAGIAGRLKGKTDAVLEFFSGGSMMYVFLLDIQSGRVRHVSLNPSALENSIGRLLPYLNNPDAFNNNPAEYGKLAAGLYGQMLKPLLDGGTYPQLMVAADGLPAQLPLAALQYDEGGGHYLLNKHDFIYIFSCASLLQQMELPGGHYSAEAAFFAPFIKEPLRGLPALPQSVKEREAIAGFAPGGKSLLDKAAVKYDFLQQAPGAKLLHIASHAYAGGGAEPRIEFADSSLSLNAVYPLRLNSQLVVLSACHTGAGNVQQSEGVLSLARGFYYAGARNVISSLWEANDRSAGQLFETFYDRLTNGSGAGRALYESQLLYVQSAPAEKRSPYYWAGFVCIGDGEFSKSKKKDYTLLWAGGAFAVLAMATFFWLWQRKATGRKR